MRFICRFAQSLNSRTRKGYKIIMSLCDRNEMNEFSKQVHGVCMCVCMNNRIDKESLNGEEAGWLLFVEGFVCVWTSGYLNRNSTVVEIEASRLQCGPWNRWSSLVQNEREFGTNGISGKDEKRCNCVNRMKYLQDWVSFFFFNKIKDFQWIAKN